MTKKKWKASQRPRSASIRHRLGDSNHEKTSQGDQLNLFARLSAPGWGSGHDREVFDRVLFQQAGQALVEQAKSLSRAGVRSFVLEGDWAEDSFKAAEKQASFGILLSALRQVCSEDLLFMSSKKQGHAIARVGFCDGFLYRCPLSFFDTEKESIDLGSDLAEGPEVAYFISSFEVMSFLKQPAWTWRENARYWAERIEGRTLYIEAPRDWSSEVFRERWMVWICLLREYQISLSLFESDCFDFWKEDTSLFSQFDHLVMEDDWSSLSPTQIREKRNAFQKRIRGA